MGYLDVVHGARDLLRWADFQVQGGYTAAQSLLKMANRPDALLVGNNQMMIGTLRAIVDLGMSPHEVGLIGFDELEWAEFSSPSLSTIGQPTYDIGQSAARLLAARRTFPGTELIRDDRGRFVAEASTDVDNGETPDHDSAVADHWHYYGDFAVH